MSENQETSGAATKGRIDRPGGITYIQIPAVDPELSADFFEAVFGWRIRQRGTSHVTFEDASGDVIGAWRTDLTISRDPGILPYIYVSGIDAVVENITRHGGEIVKTPYPEGGLWVATFRDPAGNILGIWQMGDR